MACNYKQQSKFAASSSQTQLKAANKTKVQFKLDLYSVGLICGFILQLFFCCGMVYWTKGKLFEMKKEQDK